MRRRAPAALVSALLLAGAVGVAAPPAVEAEQPAAAPAGVNGCWSSDNGDPVLDGLDLEPDTVDVTDGPAQVAVTVDAHDTGGPGAATGIDRASLYATNGADGRAARYLRTTLTRGGDGLWHGTLTVPRGSGDHWDVAGLTLFDGGYGAVELDNVTMRFGGVTALDKVSLYVERGEIAGLIGPNGAGKTTVFNAITGVFTPTEGTITFDGQSLAGRGTSTSGLRRVRYSRVRRGRCAEAPLGPRCPSQESWNQVHDLKLGKPAARRGRKARGLARK